MSLHEQLIVFDIEKVLGLNWVAYLKRVWHE